MSNENGLLEKILEAREKRAQTQRELIHIYKTSLVSFTLNIPGPEKNNPSFTKILEIGINLLEGELEKQNIDIVHRLVRITPAGNEAFLNIVGDAEHLKRITIEIEENHPLGRLFDFDVLTIDLEQISRAQLDLPERKCIICNESAKICGRSRKHSVENLLNIIHELIDEYSYKNA